MSQADLARLADISLRTVEQIEANVYNPSLRIICQLADALDINVSELLAPPAEKPERRRGKKSTVKATTSKKR